MERNIVLVQPRTGSWDYLGARIPEGLLGIASIPEKEGYKVTVIDQRVEPDWEEKLRTALRTNPIVVGTTAMTGPQIKFSLELSRIVKEFNRDIPVMWGGMHPTMQPHQTLGVEDVDIITIGEGELTFAELVHTLERGGDLHNVLGIGFKENGKAVINPPRPTLKNLDELPDLPYHLVDVKKYFPRKAVHNTHNEQRMPLQVHFLHRSCGAQKYLESILRRTRPGENAIHYKHLRNKRFLLPGRQLRNRPKKSEGYTEGRDRGI
jgi:radical SAM superfamily enzyme YgiQ (UPF0313 family)